LVNYRRQSVASHTDAAESLNSNQARSAETTNAATVPDNSSTAPVPVSGTQTPDQPIARPPLRIPSRSQSYTIAQRQHSSLESHPQHHHEVPEVALVNNKHVVPDWLFARGGRMTKKDMDKYKNWQTSGDPDPSDSPSRSSRSLERRRSHKRAPDSDFPSAFLPLSSSQSTDTVLQPPPGSPSSIALRSYSPSSPARSFGHPHLHHSTSTPLLHGRPNTGVLQNSQRCPTQQLFEGTGSTTVHTKLKDHIFSTILKRMQKGSSRPQSRRSFTRNDSQEPEGESTDQDQEDNVGPLPPSERYIRRGRLTRKMPSSMDLTPAHESADDEPFQPIKRISSEVIMSELTKMSLHDAHEGGVPAPSRMREGSMERGMWSMDESVSHADDVDSRSPARAFAVPVPC
jgi:inositol-hexakisphosphate kinase